MQIRPVGLLAVRSRSEATWAESLRRVNEKLGDLRVAAHTGSMLRTARSESLIRGVHRAAQNLQDAWNLTATAEGGTRQILDKVQELRSLAIRAAQAMWTEDEWKSMQDQVRQTLWGISEISNGTRYNGIPVLLGDIEGEPTGIPTAEGYGPRGQSVTRSISPTVTPLGASGSRAHSSQSFSVTDPVDLKHTLPRWSADGTLIRATRTLDNGSTQTVHYDSAGSVGLSPPGGMTFDAVARTSVTIAGEIWQMSRLSNGINGHADGLYVRKDTEPWTRLLTFPSGNSQFSFSPAGDRIALVRNAGATGATIQIHDFTQGPPPTLRAGHNINLDGDTDGVPQTYGLAGFNLYPLADGSPSIGINVVSQHTGVSRNLAWDSTGTDGYSVDYVAKTITFHSSATLDSNDTLTFTGVTGSNGTDPVTGVPFVEIGLTHAPVQYRLDSVAAGLTDGTARSSTPASVIVSVGGHTVAWDPSGTNGWSFTDNRTIRLHGAARPTATQGIKVDYRTDYTVNSGGSMTPRDDDGDGAVDLVFSETPEIYGLDDALAAQALAGLRGGTALRAVSSAGGGLDDLVYDPVTRTLTFQGTSQGTLAQDLGQRYFADQGLVQDTDGTLEIQLARASDTWGLAAPDQDGLIRGAGTNDLDALKVITNGTVQLSGWQLESADPRRLNLDSPGILPDAMQSLDHSIRA